MSDKIQFTHGYALHETSPEGNYTKMEICWAEGYGYAIHIRHERPDCEPVITKLRMTENGTNMLFALLTFRIHRDMYKLEPKDEQTTL